MGFYPPASLVRDAQRHSVQTLPPDVNASAAMSEVQEAGVRVGLSFVQGIGEDDATALVEERDRNGPFTSVRGLAQRASLSQHGLEALVQSGACDCLGLKRRELLWQLGLVPRSQSVPGSGRSEEHTSELQSPMYLVCRL